MLLFVTAKTSNAFTVQGVTLAGQPATCSFDYRIVAKRLGYEDLRLEPVPMKGQGEPDPIMVQPLSLQVPRPDLNTPEPKP